MTKREVRASILSILAPEKDEILWDIGAGTGSVSVELALQASMGRTYAVECNEEALTLIQQKPGKLGAWNLHMVKGKAPEKLDTLETPDAVFIGGSKGKMEPILSLIRTKNPKARLCISAICIETLYRAVRALEENGWQADVTQISVSRSRPAGSLHLMAAQNSGLPHCGGAGMMACLVAAPSSGSGKTAVTCALLALLARRGLMPCAFKCGPDYIDPMFHRSVLGVESHNLDLFFSSESFLRQHYARHCAGHQAAVCEGVMGFYDGVGGTTSQASAWHVAHTLDMPVLLVIRPGAPV